MSYPKCPECGWSMNEDVRTSGGAHAGAVWRCSNPDCDHVQEQDEQTIF